MNMNEIEYGNKVLSYYAIHCSLEGMLRSAVGARGAADSRASGKEAQRMCDDAVALSLSGQDEFRDPEFRRIYDGEDVYRSMKTELETRRGGMLLSMLSILRRLDGLSCQDLDTPSGDLFTKAWQSWETPEANLSARVQAAFSCLYSFDPHQMEEVEWRDVRGYLLNEATRR